eukprot:645482-Lingulodinium_polyedra.AAC.1
MVVVLLRSAFSLSDANSPASLCNFRAASSPWPAHADALAAGLPDSPTSTFQTCCGNSIWPKPIPFLLSFRTPARL